MLFKKLETVFSLFVLLGTTWVVAATSSYVYETGNYYISSDCVSPIVEEEAVFVKLGTVVAPPDKAFTDYGLPVDDISDESAISGDVNGQTRVCENTFDPGGSNHTKIFSCQDDGEFACMVILREPAEAEDPEEE